MRKHYRVEKSKKTALGERQSFVGSELDDPTQVAIDCLIHQFKVFRIQTLDNIEASYLDACHTCNYIEKCKCEWIETMEPIYKKSNVKISVCI